MSRRRASGATRRAASLPRRQPRKGLVSSALLARRASPLALALTAVWPALALACATCSGADDRNRDAFFKSTVFLTLLPLALLVAGFVWWSRGGREWLRREFDDRDAWTPPAEPKPPGS